VKYEQHKELIEKQAAALGVECTTLGSPKAPVMLVGTQMYAGEKIPFSSPRSAPAINLVQQLGVPKEMIHLTNLCRLPVDQEVQPSAIADETVEFLLNYVQEHLPKAVVLMGGAAIRILGGPQINDLRLRRWVWAGRFKKTTFFATHDPSVASGQVGLLSVPAAEFMMDVKAVLETDRTTSPRFVR
jgi:uracil-DNA glycosylase